MNRHKFVALIGGVLVASLVGAQQPEKVYRIGGLSIGPRFASKLLIAAFDNGLRDRGYACAA
jgi:hypothetical protein